MLEPDFCESQLQVICNMLICVLLGNGAFPIIPSLAQEWELGWDSGFIIGGSPTPAPDQKGCNFFIQYKLAKLLEGPQSGQFQYWSEPYFGFQIPHGKRDEGWYYNDYHQYHRLKALSQRGYLALYISNSVTNVQHLFEISVNGLDAITAAVNLSDINGTHKFITYTAASSHVMLHSEPVKAPKQGGRTFFNLIKVSRATTLQEDLLDIPKAFEDPLLRQFTPKRNLNFLENWGRMTALIYSYSGIRTYKWFPPIKKAPAL